MTELEPKRQLSQSHVENLLPKKPERQSEIYGSWFMSLDTNDSVLAYKPSWKSPHIKPQAGTNDVKTVYTYNAGEPAAPKILIWTSQGEVCGVGGSDAFFDIEPAFLTILEIKLWQLSGNRKPADPNLRAYIQERKAVREIELYLKNDQELNTNQLQLLYNIQLDSVSLVNGLEDNDRYWRIEQILNSRNHKKDIATILNCTEEQVILTARDKIPKNYIYMLPKLTLCVSSNPNSPQWLLARLAEHSDSVIRQKVSSNPSTPTASLEILAQDTNLAVRGVAQKNLNLNKRR